MELKQWTYEEYPEFHYEHADGIIPSTGDEIGVRYLNDIIYATVDGHDLHLQFQYPKTRNQPEGTNTFPCVVYVQGSAWMKQDIHSGIPLLSKLSEQGFVTALVEYRHSGIASFPACAVDAKNAVRFLKNNAETYHLDPEKMILAGSSSGGHTALFGGILQDDDKETNLFPGTSAQVKGIINFYGSTSFMAEDSNPSTTNHCMPDSPEGMEMGGVNMNEHPEYKRALSVECNITEETKLPPVLNLHGTKDRIVNPSCSVAVHEQLKKTNHESYLYLLQGADHGGPEFFAPQTLDVIVPFIHKCIR